MIGNGFLVDAMSLTKGIPGCLWENALPQMSVEGE